MPHRYLIAYSHWAGGCPTIDEHAKKFNNQYNKLRWTNYLPSISVKGKIQLPNLSLPVGKLYMLYVQSCSSLANVTASTEIAQWMSSICIVH